MNCFLVERSLPGMSPPGLAALQHVLRAATHRVSTSSSPVRYVLSVYVPRTQTCMCVFEAANIELVRHANEMAQTSFTSIQEAVALF